MTKLRLPVLVLSMVLVFLMILSVSTYGVTGNPVNVGVKPDTYGINLSSQNLKYLWNYTSSNGNFNYTAAGDLFNNNMMGFIGYSVSAGSATLSGINNDGAAVWNLSITNYINFTVYGRVGSYSQTILVESGQSSAPGLLHLTLYAGSTGSPIWERNITLSSGESSLVLPLGYSMTTGSTSGNNDTIVLVSSNSSGPYTTENYENSIRLINGANGTVQWYVNYSTTSVGSTPLSRFLQVIPPVTGLTDGGVLYNVLSITSGLPPVITSNLVLIKGDGSVAFNITTPTSASLTASFMVMDSVGNYAGSGYDIAVSLLDIQVSSSGSYTEYSALAVLSMSGTAVYTHAFTSDVNSTVVLEQSTYYGILSALYRLPPVPYIGPLYSYGSSTNPDLLFELVTQITGSSGIKYVNSLSLLDVSTGSYLWTDNINSIITSPIIALQLSYNLNGTSSHSIIVESLPASTFATQTTIIAINGGTGATIWDLTNVTGTGIPIDLLASITPGLMTFNTTVPDFVIVSNGVSNGGSAINVTLVNGNNGRDILEKGISFSKSIMSYTIYPLGIVTDDKMPDFAINVKSANVNNVYTETLIGINGTNGNILFTVSANLTGNEPDLSAVGGTLWSQIYPGLNNGQLTSDGRTDDMLLSTYSGLSGVEVIKYALLSASIHANNQKGVKPLSVSFNVTVTGGVAPYSYTWYPEGSGNTSAFTTVPFLNYTYVAAGNYTALVTVKDNAGNVVSSSVAIEVYNSSSNTTTTHNGYYMVTGIVVYNGTGLSGVAISSNSGNITTTNGTGYFTFYAKNGTYNITASKQGYNTSYESATVNGATVNLPPLILHKPSVTPPPPTKNTTQQSSTNMAFAYIIIIVVVVAVVVVLLLLFVRKKK